MSDKALQFTLHFSDKCCKHITISSQINNTAPIGIFDSGVGGLSIAKCIAEKLPNEQLIYVADTQFAPYGEKSIDLITNRVNSIANSLIKQGVKAIVIACNTATVNAIEQLRAQVHVPIIGVEPAIKPAALNSLSKKVAILVTQATSENQRFKDLINRHQNGTKVFIQPCPGLVELVERDLIASPQCVRLLKKYIEPLLTQGVDSIVLGCTHYPFLQQQIQHIIRQRQAVVTIVETAMPVTQQLNKVLKENQLISRSCHKNDPLFYSSRADKAQQVLFSHLWKRTVNLQSFNEIT